MFMMLHSYNFSVYSMFRAAGLKSALLQGIAKSPAYTVGDPVKSLKTLRNSWVAVYVEGGWRLVFPRWAYLSPRNKSVQSGNGIVSTGKSKGFRDNYYPGYLPCRWLTREMGRDGRGSTRPIPSHFRM